MSFGEAPMPIVELTATLALLQPLVLPSRAESSHRRLRLSHSLLCYRHQQGDERLDGPPLPAAPEVACRHVCIVASSPPLPRRLSPSSARRGSGRHQQRGGTAPRTSATATTKPWSREDAAEQGEAVDRRKRAEAAVAAAAPKGEAGEATT